MMLLASLACFGGFGDVAVAISSVDSSGVVFGDCPSEDVVDELTAHVLALDAFARGIGATPEPGAAPVFLDVPGAHYGSWFLAAIDPPCPDALPEPVCAGGLCYAVTCPGEGWAVDVFPSEDASYLTWTSKGVGQRIGWDEAGGYLVELYANSVTPAGETFEGDGVGHLDGALQLNWSFEEAGAPALLTWDDGVGGLWVDGVQIAPWSGDSFDDGACAR